MLYTNLKHLESADIKNLRSGETQSFKTDGTFIFIGYIPNTGFLKGKVELNTWDEIVVKSDMSTSITGVYAAGDSTAKRFRQVTTAVGDGTIVALAASIYLNDLKVKYKQLINQQ
jgi:thioredoxin reductase (NADPH)